VREEAPAQAMRRGRAWLGRGVWTVADQALYAGANFALNVVLARELTPAAYGAFTTGFITFLLLGAIHGGLLVEPVLVFGAGRFRSRWALYLRWAVGAHVRLALAAGGALALGAAGALLMGQVVLAEALAGFAIAQGGVLALWLLRRACHVVARPQWAAAAGAVYLVLLLGTGYALDLGHHLNALSAPLLMGGAALVTAAALAVPLGLRPGRVPEELGREAREAHHGYGRFSAWTGVLEWVQGSMAFLIVPFFAGLEGTALLRAAYNLAMPALQAASALTVMSIPILVRAGARGTLKSTAVRLGGLLVGGAVLYGVLAGLFGGPVMEWLYRGVYTAGPGLRWALAVLPAASVLAGVLAAVLRAQERPRAVLAARGVSVVGGAALTAGLSAVAGVPGALVAESLTLGVEAAGLAVALHRGVPATPAPPLTPAAVSADHFSVLPVLEPVA